MKEKKFIKLHLTDDNKPLMCKIESIRFITLNENGDTIIYVNDSEYDSFNVHESIEKIYDMIEGNKDTTKTTTEKK